jgi:hypothetical protein
MNLSIRSLVVATLIGTVLQVLMVVLGHSNPVIKHLFAVGGMGISLIAGILYAVFSAEPPSGPAIVGGIIAGAVCAFLGILVSVILKDVAASLLLLGTISSAVTGALGGWLGRLFAGGRV